MRSIRLFLADKRAAAAIEYGVLLAVIALVVAVGIGAVGDEIVAMFSDNGSKLQEAFHD